MTFALLQSSAPMPGPVLIRPPLMGFVAVRASFHRHCCRKTRSRPHRRSPPSTCSRASTPAMTLPPSLRLRVADSKSWSDLVVLHHRAGFRRLSPCCQGSRSDVATRSKSREFIAPRCRSWGSSHWFATLSRPSKKSSRSQPHRVTTAVPSVTLEPRFRRHPRASRCRFVRS